MKKLLFLILLLPQSALALDFIMPLECNYGKNCFISSYFGHKQEDRNITDHNCGIMGEGGSTDFIVTHDSTGVPVLAAESGTVKYVRDGMGDGQSSLAGHEAIRGRECGNGVIIEHEREHKTQYCHMANGSITVKPGDKVEKGRKIGQAGFSGLTEFRRLAFTATENGVAVDPFTGPNRFTGSPDVPCESLDIYPLWTIETEEKLEYITTKLIGAGFSASVPKAQEARAGQYREKVIHTNPRFFAFWTDIFGIMAGDGLRLTVISPDGKEIKKESRVFDGEEKFLFFFLTIPRPDKPDWPSGDYTGRVELLREGKTIIDHREVMELSR